MNVTSSSRAGSRLPPVDAHLVAEDSGYEIIEGRLVPVPPAHEPHAERHSKVNALLEAFVTAEYNVACDMLTRTSEIDDVAPDASVYPVERDPETGGRQLEVLAFQIVAAETLSHAGKKAHVLAERGVRRVFAVDVEHQRVLEWSNATGSWQMLPEAGAIDDPAFIAPLPVDALAKAAKADDAIAAALLAKRNRVLVASEARAATTAREEGLEQGRMHARRALLRIMESRGLSPTPEQRRCIEATRDLALLERWAVRAAVADDAHEVFDPSE